MTNDKEAGWAKVGSRQSVDDLVNHGPAIRLEVSDQSGGPKITALAQIDTGAGVTCISSRLAQKLALKPIHTAELHQPGMAAAEMSCFEVRLTHPLFEVDIIVGELATLDPPHDVLFGRDLLKGGRLAVDFTTGLTALHIRAS